MEIVNIHKAKTNLSKLIAQVAKGKEIVIANAGTPVAVLGPFKKPKQTFPFGILKGKVVIHKDFDKLPKEFMQHFS